MKSLVRRFILGESVRERLYTEMKKNGKLLALVQNPKKTFPIVDKEFWVLPDGCGMKPYVVYICRKDKDNELYRRSVEGMEQVVTDCDSCFGATPVYNFLEQVYRDVKSLNKFPFVKVCNSDAYDDLYEERPAILESLDRAFIVASETYSILDMGNNDDLKAFNKNIDKLEKDYNRLIENMLRSTSDDAVESVVIFVRNLAEVIEEEVCEKYKGRIGRILDDAAIRDNNI